MSIFYLTIIAGGIIVMVAIMAVVLAIIGGKNK